MAIVELRGVRKAYGRVEALCDVTFDIEEGVTGLLGPNGAGKSTLLLCVLGLLPDWHGEATVLGSTPAAHRRAIRRRVGFMPEQDALLPEMTAIRAVRHLARLSGLPSAEALRRAHEVLWHVGLGEAIYREVEEYSVGMRQRFKLAQALVHDPDLLFLDEPLSGLDPAGRDELLRLVQDLAVATGSTWCGRATSCPRSRRWPTRWWSSTRGASGARSGWRTSPPFPAGTRWRRRATAKPSPRRCGAGGSPPTRSRRARSERPPSPATPWRSPCPPGRGLPDLLRLARVAGARVRRATPLREDLDAVFHRLLAGGKEARGMTVHARGYRTYEGPRDGGSAALAIAGEAIRSTLARKSFRRLAIIYLVWFAFVSFVLYVALGMGEPSIAQMFGVRRRTVTSPDLPLSSWTTSSGSSMPAVGRPDRPARDLRGAPLVADDLGANAFPLYLVRPIRPLDYVLGKSLVFPALLAVATLLPGVALLRARRHLAAARASPGRSWPGTCRRSAGSWSTGSSPPRSTAA